MSKRAPISHGVDNTCRGTAPSPSGFWKYGVAENARDLDAITRYACEQGLAERKLTAENLFHRGTLEMSKI